MKLIVIGRRPDVVVLSWEGYLVGLQEQARGGLDFSNPDPKV
jgi:hypothetical protein